MKMQNDCLYHYTTINGIKGIIETKSIYATNIFYLNDASEFQYAHKLLVQEIDNRISNGSAIRSDLISYLHTLRAVTASLINIKNNGIYVSSFSEKQNLLSQWRGYCSDSAGFCVGFKFSDIYKLHEILGNKYARCGLVKCLYNKSEQQKKISSLIDEFIERINKIDERTALRETGKIQLDILYKFIELAPEFKHPAFEEEQEWRLILLSRTLEKKKVKFRTASTMLVPYIEVPLMIEKKPIINEIMIGPAPNQLLSQSSLFECLSRNGFGNCKISISNTPFRNL